MVNLNTRKFGSVAEDLACNYLQANGLLLVERNFYCRLGEIDLIMRDRDDIVFVEVRSRKHHLADSDLNPIDSIDLYKQKKIVNSATFFLQKKRWLDKVNCRFDVIGIHNSQLEWIKNAFYADNF